MIFKVLLIIVILSIIFCYFSKIRITGGSFYKIQKNKKCNDRSIIKTNITNLKSCMNDCFKTENCVCMSYNLLNKNCNLSSKDTNLELDNTNITLIKNRIFRPRVYKTVYNIKYNNDIYGLIKNSSKFELVKLTNEIQKMNIDNISYNFYKLEHSNKTLILSYNPKNLSINNIIVGVLNSNSVAGFNTGVPTQTGSAVSNNKFKKIKVFSRYKAENIQGQSINDLDLLMSDSNEVYDMIEYKKETYYPKNLYQISSKYLNRFLTTTNFDFLEKAENNLFNIALNKKSRYCQEKIIDKDKNINYKIHCNVNYNWNIRYNIISDTYTFINNKYLFKLGDIARSNQDVNILIPKDEDGNLSFILIKQVEKIDNIQYYYLKHPQLTKYLAFLKTKKINPDMICKQCKINNATIDLDRQPEEIINIENYSKKNIHCADLCRRNKKCNEFYVTDRICSLFGGNSTTGVCSDICDNTGSFNYLVWIDKTELDDNKYNYLWTINESKDSYNKYANLKNPGVNYNLRQMGGDNSCSNSYNWTNKINGIGNNGNGLNCSDYEDFGLCNDGEFTERGQNYKGKDYDYPEYNCCSCGRKYNTNIKCDLRKLKNECDKNSRCSSIEIKKIGSNVECGISSNDNKNMLVFDSKYDTFFKNSEFYENKFLKIKKDKNKYIQYDDSSITNKLKEVSSSNDATLFFYKDFKLYPLVKYGDKYTYIYDRYKNFEKKYIELDLLNYNINTFNGGFKNNSILVNRDFIKAGASSLGVVLSNQGTTVSLDRYTRPPITSLAPISTPSSSNELEGYRSSVSDYLLYNYLRDKNREQSSANKSASNQLLKNFMVFYYNHKFNNYFINRDILSKGDFGINTNFLSKIKKSFRSIYESPTDIRIDIMENNDYYTLSESNEPAKVKKYHNHLDSCIYKRFIDLTNLDSLILKYNDIKPTFTCLQKLINNIEKVYIDRIPFLNTNYKIIFLCDVYHKNTLKYKKYEPYNNPRDIYSFLTEKTRDNEIKRTTDNTYLINNVIVVKDNINDTLEYLRNYLTNSAEKLLKILSIVNISFVDNYLPFLMNKYLSTTRQVADIYKLLDRDICNVFNIRKINSGIYDRKFEIEKKYIRKSIVDTVDSEKFSEYYLIGENIIDEEYITEENYSFDLRNKKYYYMYKQYKNQIKRGRSNLALDKIRDLILDKMILEKDKFINSKNQMILTGQPVATGSSSQNTIYNLEYILNLTEQNNIVDLRARPITTSGTMPPAPVPTINSSAIPSAAVPTTTSSAITTT